MKLTPKEVATSLWELDDSEQAEMFSELFKVAGGGHRLMLQFLHTRDRCEERYEADYTDEALESFQTMFSSGYKYIIG